MTDFHAISRDKLIELLGQANSLLETALGTIDTQNARIVALAERIKELENRLGKDSHNSNKPPSTDGFRKPGPKPKSQRGRSGRPSGGQKGHPGRTLKFSEQPHNVVVHAPVSCRDCGASLAAADVLESERRQVFDLPPIALIVTEHQAQTRCCPDCGCPNRAEFPETVDHPVQYGPRVKAVATYLSGYQLLPMERVADLFFELFGFRLSEGTLANATQRAATKLADVENAIRDALRRARILHLDETGLRIDGKLCWLHVSSTSTLTYYSSQTKRGGAALDKIDILSEFEGRAIHDGWAAYQRFDCQHGLCNAHHLRELTAVEEQLGQPWAKQMKELLLEIKKSVDHAKAQDQLSLPPPELMDFAARYRAILQDGYTTNPQPEATGKRGRQKQGTARSLLLRLDNRQSEALAFMCDFTVPFDNNQAERDLRMMKVKQKVSGCFRSATGAKAFCTIRGYVSTIMKQGHSALSALQRVFENDPIMPDLTA